ncbi:MAG: energy-coupling factor transporter transmembrane component T family protein [Corynebacterium sp.]|uniref:energy-coupling factor transporter transmembrane component T family protein n=1 Tax=Corynebacterium sp. TaxID=1720 RepID=UPI003F955C8F
MGVLERTDPTTRLLVMLLVGTPLMATVDLTSAAVALVLEVLVLAPFCGYGAGAGARRLLRRAWPVLVIAPLAGLSALLYARPGGASHLSFGPVNVTENSVTLATALTVRVVAIALPAVMLTTGLDPTRLGDGMVQLWRLPERFVVGAVAGVRLVGLFRRDWAALERSRRARGLGDGAKVGRLAGQTFALLVLALRRAGRLSTVMEGRGFTAGGTTPRTRAREATLGRWDAVLAGLGVAVPVLALATAAVTGSFTLLGVH